MKQSQKFAALFISIVFIAPVAVLSQSAGLPTSDIDATTIISGVSASSGWTVVPRDVVARGTITIHGPSGDDTHAVVYKAQGRSRMRFEHGTDGTQTSIVDFDKSTAEGPNGSQIPAAMFHPWVLPFVSDILDGPSGTRHIGYIGRDQLPEPCYKLRLWRTYPPLGNSNSLPITVPGSELIVWISNTTLLPVQVQYQSPQYNSRAFATYIRKYSSYSKINGLSVPLHQEQWFRDRLLYTVDLTDVQMNVGVADGDFRIGGR